MSKPAGFTIVEILITMALVSVALLALITMQAEQSKSQASIGLEMQAKQTLHEIASRVTARPGSFPILENAGGNPIVYAACFNDDGSPKDRADGNPGFTGVYAPTDPPTGAFLTSVISNPAFVCEQNRGGLEAHVYRDPANPNTITLYVVIIPHLTAGGQNARGFVPANLSYTLTVNL